jgi:hypothetical protein
MPLRRLLSALLLACLAACSSLPTPAPPVAEKSATALLVPAEALNADVTQGTIQETICVPGYTASVRPSTSFTNGVKTRLLREQGLPASAAPEYELDHRVPLALGGHPRSLKNLVLQRWAGEDGAKKKDRLERKLQQLVYAYAVQLEVARRAIFFDWQTAYRTYVSAP